MRTGDVHRTAVVMYRGVMVVMHQCILGANSPHAVVDFHFSEVATVMREYKMCACNDFVVKYREKGTQ